MEISLFTPQTIRIKSKQVSLAVNPVAGKKIACDAALFFERAQSFEVLGLEGNKLIIDGAGDYEIGGVKITGIRQQGINSYDIQIETIDLFISKASALNKMKDIKEVEVVAIEADTTVNQTAIAALNANVLLFYGDQATENIKSLGKEVASVSKYPVTRDKLPAETQILLLS